MISICIITKDERENLNNCLQKLMPLGYELIIVDTGSIDDSKEIAAKYTKNVYDFPWCNNFSAARNFALSKATNEMVLMIDSDEFVIKVDKDLLEQSIIKNKGKVGRIRIKNVFESKGRIFYSTNLISRLFSKNQFRYKGKIHEQVEAMDGELFETFTVDVFMEHTGYNGAKEDRGKKAQRNIELLNQVLEEEGEDPYILYQLGKSHYYGGDYRRASFYFDKALYFDLDPRTEYVADLVETYGYSLINSKQERKALLLENIYKEFSYSVEFVFMLGNIYMENAMFHKAIGEFHKAVKYKEYKMDGVTSYLAYYNIGVIYDCLGEKERAIEYYRKCKEYPLAKQGIARCNGSTIERGQKRNKDFYEIVFLPYKAAMWDSLESVWIAATKDSRCRCFVIPIPYFEKNEDGSLGEVHDESNEFPPYVTITKWDNYDFKARQPDVIYFHNAYEKYNFVTSVHPDFYARELRSYTRMLVYIPYFLPSSQYNNQEEAKERKENLAAGLLYIDKVIVSSEYYKKILTINGIPEDKILLLGSPKIDSIISMKENLPFVPEEWKERMKGKVVFLLNTSISDILKNKGMLDLLKRIFIYFKHSIGYGLIWRPHPLMEYTLKSIRPQFLQNYYELINFVSSTENIIYDHSADYHTSFLLSQGLISDRSSIASLYLFTGKPVLNLYGSSKNKKKYCSLDYFGGYFRKDGMKISEFCTMVAEGKDDKKKDRMKRLERSVYGATEGSSGRRIHQSILKQIKYKEGKNHGNSI